MLRSVLSKTGGVALGTALGQGLIFLITPYLSRTYTPADFGTLALLMSITNISIASACFRYDMAIPSADDLDVRGLVAVCSCSALCSAVFVVIAVLLLHGATRGVAQLTVFHDYPLLVGTAVFFAGMFQATIALYLKERKVGGVAWMRALQGLIYTLLAPFT